MKPAESKYLRFQKFAPPALLLLFTLLFFRNVLGDSRILLYRDLFFFHYPLRYYWVSQWFHGFLPFLNESINGGQPLLANPNYAVFYPGNILFALLPFNRGWNWSLILHVYWGALGIYCWMRSFGCSATACFVAATAFAFSGPMLSGMNYYNLLIAASWMPWILYSTGEALDRGGRRIAIAAICLCAQILAGEPTIQLLTLAFQILICASRINKSTIKTLAARFLWVEVLALALSAVQILPTLLWLPHSGRGETLDFRTSAAYWSMPPARFIELLIPGFFGNPMSLLRKDFWGGPVSDGGYPYIFRIYCGWIPLLLVPFALKTKNGRAAVLIAVAAFLLAMGRHLPGYETIFTMLPPLRIIRYPEKFLLLASFSLAIAAAFGFDALFQERAIADFRRSLNFALICILIISVASLLRWPFWMTETQRQIQLLASGFAFASLILSAGIILFLIRRPNHILGLLLVIVFALDLFFTNQDIVQTQSTISVEKPPLFLYYHPQIKDTPIYHHGEDEMDVYFSGEVLPEQLMIQALHPLLGLRWGIRYGATNDIDRMSWKLSEARERWMHAHFPNQDALEEMRRAGIARVLSLSPLHDIRLQTEYFLQYKLDKFIWIYRIAPDALPPVRWQSDGAAVAWQSSSPYHLSITASPEKAGALLILRNAIPGWKCLLDGKKAIVKSSAQGWMLVDVPKGRHGIELTFFPPGLQAGLILSALASMLALRSLLLA